MKSKGGVFVVSLAAVFLLAACSPVLTNTPSATRPLLTCPKEPSEYRIRQADQFGVGFVCTTQLNESKTEIMVDARVTFSFWNISTFGTRS